MVLWSGLLHGDQRGINVGVRIFWVKYFVVEVLQSKVSRGELPPKLLHEDKIILGGQSAQEWAHSARDSHKRRC